MSTGSPWEAMVVGLASTGGLTGVRALSRRNTVAKGSAALAQILHVEHVAEGGILNQEFLLIQVAVPRPDGVEIVAVARVPWRSGDTMPEPGWTVPVTYRERLGTTPRAEITGPYTRVPKADPAGPST